MERELKNYGGSLTAGTTYVVSEDYRITGDLTFPANVTLLFKGGKILGSYTLRGTNTSIVAPVMQIFDESLVLAGTWKVEKVYAENFGNTDGSNSNVAINKALKFSNLTGCKVQLLGKKYMINQPIVIHGNTALEGTVMGPSQLSDSRPSQQGTVIEATGSINAINVETRGTQSDLDCLRFWINNLNIRHLGTGTAINIFSTAADTFLTVRSGYITNIKIKQTDTGGYGIRIEGGSYLKFDNISISGGLGVKVTARKNNEGKYVKYLTEFLWFNKVALGDVKNTSFEITQGNNLYLTEIDTNDSDTGLLISNETGGTFNVFVNRFNSARCVKGIHIKSYNDYITRIKVSEATILQTKVVRNGTNVYPIAALYFDRAADKFIGESIFENINIDALESDILSTYRGIMEVGNSLDKCKFINIRCGRKTQLRDSNQLTFMGIKQSGLYTANGGSTTYTIPLSSNSPFPGKPIVMVNTNKNIPYSVATTNTSGSTSAITVTFATAPTGSVALSYFLTGYYSA